MDMNDVSSSGAGYRGGSKDAIARASVWIRVFRAHQSGIPVCRFEGTNPLRVDEDARERRPAFPDAAIQAAAAFEDDAGACVGRVGGGFDVFGIRRRKHRGLACSRS